MKSLSFLAVAALSLASCVGTTGSEIVTFRASVAGPAEARQGVYAFTSGRGYRVTLTRMRLYIGAVYLNRSMSLSGGQERSCTLPGVYVGEVTAGDVFDALSPEKQPFPVLGQGTADPAVTGELWLASSDVNATDSITVVLDVAGTAERDGASYPFDGRVTIGRNRLIPPTDPARPGANPICKQRIVTPIPLTPPLTPKGGGELVVRVHPESFFANVEFAELPELSSSPLLYRFTDGPADAPSINLFQGLLGATGTYTFEWQ